MHQIAADDRDVLAAAEGERDMSWRMARRRQDARMIADLIIMAHDIALFGLDDGQHTVAEWRHRRLRVLLGPVIEFVFRKYLARVRKRRHPAAVLQPAR